MPDARSLFCKLAFREGWSPLLPWVKAELQERHNFRCCETIEEFQQASERAMTRQRHLKHNLWRHEKDDRDRVTDPRYYVLGWDNREKKRRLAEAIDLLKQHVSQIDSRITQMEQSFEQVRRRIRFIEDAEQFKLFADIDFANHEREIAQLRLELKAIEENNETIQILQQRLAQNEQRIRALEHNRDQTLRREQALESEIADGMRIVQHHRHTLARKIADNSFAVHAESFTELDGMLASDPLSLENLSQRPDAFRQNQQNEVRRLRDDLEPLRESVVKSMSRFLNANPAELADLDVSVQFLDDFVRLLVRIRSEDLPRFESQFKERLNEKVGQEIGVLRGNLNTQRIDIEDRIQLLNVSLRQVPFGNGSYMALVAKPVRDPEIATFRQDLDACVSGQFEGTLAANEARFSQIESLINKLRDEERWRLKVTDVAQLVRLRRH